MTERFVANNLKEVIEAQGRTKRWVAQRAGFSEGMLSHIIAGRKTISREAGELIAQALDVPFFVLFMSRERNEMNRTDDMPEAA